ncbi:CopD family protein [Hydrogenophilus thiooxidans]|uniref:CopD family protein n=1 Tax=Hydrogenophilus thiooxidans TaxID=2820326 RepID=UPI002017E002|nr:CopD family protein [Hydrogenophilus thiooxidans]
MTSWFAGLFYLPRIFVNLAMEEHAVARDRLLLMARKLFRFMTPLGVLAVLFGLWLWFGFGFSGGWLHTKTTLVGLLIAYHAYCGVLLNRFEAGANTRSHLWYRFYNEIPVVILTFVVFLVVLKPF